MIELALQNIEYTRQQPTIRAATHSGTGLNNKGAMLSDSDDLTITLQEYIVKYKPVQMVSATAKEYSTPLPTTKQTNYGVYQGIDSWRTRSNNQPLIITRH